MRNLRSNSWAIDNLAHLLRFVTMNVQKSKYEGQTAEEVWCTVSRKSLENKWKSFEVIMKAVEFHGSPWKSYEVIWKLSRSHGSWKSGVQNFGSGLHLEQIVEKKYKCVLIAKMKCTKPTIK